MVFYGHHGVTDAEKELGQRIEVDLELTADFAKAMAEDDLKATLNYEGVYLLVKQVVEDGTYNLIEGIAGDVVKRLGESYELDQIRIRVRKPHPPLGGLVDSVEFEVVKTLK
jgi:dihydroneopterin aldolase